MGIVQDGSIGLFSTNICHLLQRCDEEDDATSARAEPANAKPKSNVQNLQAGEYQ